MNDLTVLQHHPKAVSAEVGGEIIFLHEGEGVYFSLDGVGASLWKALETPRTFGDLIQALLNEYEVEEAVLREDLSALVMELTGKGLLGLDLQ